MQVIEVSAVAMAIAQETVRLKQAVKSTYRVAIKPAVVAGVNVPPGTVVQAYWHSATLATGPGVEEFRPDYWLSGDRRTCRINDDPNSMQVWLQLSLCIVRGEVILQCLIYAAHADVSQAQAPVADCICQ